MFYSHFQGVPDTPTRTDKNWRELMICTKVTKEGEGRLDYDSRDLLEMTILWFQTTN
jgi:hypothetical protein